MTANPCKGCGPDKVPVPRRELEALQRSASNARDLASRLADARTQISNLSAQISQLQEQLARASQHTP